MELIRVHLRDSRLNLSHIFARSAQICGEKQKPDRSRADVKIVKLKIVNLKNRQT
jgi:hypothetical protein